MKYLRRKISITMTMLLFLLCCLTISYADYVSEESNISISIEEEYTYDIIGSSINLISEDDIIYDDSELENEIITYSEDGTYEDYIINADKLNIITIDKLDDINLYATRKSFYNMIYRSYCTTQIDHGKEVIVSDAEFNDVFDLSTSSLYEMGLIGSYSGYMYPNQYITVEEACNILSKYYKYSRNLNKDIDIEYNSYIEDIESADNKYLNDIMLCMKLNVLYLDINNNIQPKKYITIDEAINMVYNMHQYINEYYNSSDPLMDTEYNIFMMIKNNSDLNEAAICGILASMKEESKYDASIHEYGGGPGFGLCQWTTGSRKQGLYDYADVCGFAYDTMECQALYCIYELQKNFSDCYNILLNVPNTADGAYTAGYYFCKYYEAPYDLEGCSTRRGGMASTNFYNYYIG